MLCINLIQLVNFINWPCNLDKFQLLTVVVLIKEHISRWLTLVSFKLYFLFLKKNLANFHEQYISAVLGMSQLEGKSRGSHLGAGQRRYSVIKQWWFPAFTSFLSEAARPGSLFFCPGGFVNVQIGGEGKPFLSLVSTFIRRRRRNGKEVMGMGKDPTLFTALLGQSGNIQLPAEDGHWCSGNIGVVTPGFLLWLCVPHHSLSEMHQWVLYLSETTG